MFNISLIRFSAKKGFSASRYKLLKENNAIMSIKIREKTLKNKSKSLYLDICFDGKRDYEFLKIYLLPGTGPKVREQNKVLREYAEQIRNKRWGEILNNIHGVEIKQRKKINLFNYLYPIKKGAVIRGYETLGEIDFLTMTIVVV